MNVATLDLAIIIYLVGITAVGVLTGYRKKTTSEEYFLAGKSLGWFSIGSAMFASNISTIHLVGLAAAGPILCPVCIVTYVVVSLTSPPPSPRQLENACWGSPLKAVTESRITGVTDPRVVAFVLLCALYLFLH